MAARTSLLALVGMGPLLAGAALAQPWKIPLEKMHRGPDPVAQAELAAARDPTFAAVARHYPMLRAPREALGVLESAREFVVTAGGEIELNNHPMDRPGRGEAYPMVSPENTATIYFLFGKTARCLGIVGRADDARRVAAEASAYRQDIEAAMRRSVFEHEGRRLLPILPASRAWLARAHYGSTGYYSLFASLILDTEFLPANDPHAGLLVSALEQRGGLCAGTCTFFDYIDRGFTYGYWLEMLKRGEPQKAILGLYGSLAYGMSRTTYSSVECTRIETGANARTLPHLRSGTQQLRLLRMMLVREAGERLLLAQAAPQHWLTQGQRVEVQDAPTMFGSVSYTIESAVEQGRVTVQLTPPQRNPPQEIQVFVRHPEGRPIQQVLAGGQPLDTFDSGAVTLRHPRKPLTLELRYATK